MNFAILESLLGAFALLTFVLAARSEVNLGDRATGKGSDRNAESHLSNSFQSFRNGSRNA
jgi:hypothetical protein